MVTVAAFIIILTFFQIAIGYDRRATTTATAIHAIAIGTGTVAVAVAVAGSQI